MMGATEGFSEEIEGLKQFLSGIDRGVGFGKSRLELVSFLGGLEEKLRSAKTGASSLEESFGSVVSYLETRKRLGYEDEKVIIDAALNIVSKAQKQGTTTLGGVEAALLQLGKLRSDLDVLRGGLDTLGAAMGKLIAALEKSDASVGKLRLITKGVYIGMSSVALFLTAKDVYGLGAALVGGGGFTAATGGVGPALLGAAAVTGLSAQLLRQKDVLFQLSTVVGTIFEKNPQNIYAQEMNKRIDEVSTIAGNLTESIKSMEEAETVEPPKAEGFSGSYLSAAASAYSLANLAFTTTLSIRSFVRDLRSYCEKSPVDDAMEEFFNAAENFIKMQTDSLGVADGRRRLVGKRSGQRVVLRSPQAVVVDNSPRVAAVVAGKIKRKRVAREASETDDLSKVEQELATGSPQPSVEWPKRRRDAVVEPEEDERDEDVQGPSPMDM